MDGILIPLAMVTIMALDLVVWLLMIAVIMHWLMAFNILNARQPLVNMVHNFCERITQPLLQPLRKRLPYVAGVDLSPLVLILLITFIQLLIKHNVA
ncbi:MAG: YggT family protein [Alphaproteobacteria bacterium]|nr:YggT family protein [Alphaproteobacteria bacterium]NDC56423.1 YggT family protein [Alphaproteobacteria bacterium]NDG04852.1 YggT family protein [Alphaproteobacteria bacterium]